MFTRTLQIARAHTGPQFLGKHRPPTVHRVSRAVKKGHSVRAKRGSNTLAHRESNVLLNSGFPKRQTKPIGSVSQKERLELNVPPEEEKKPTKFNRLSLPKEQVKQNKNFPIRPIILTC